MPDDLEPTDDAPTDDSPVIRDLREKAKRADAAEAEAEAVRRELTLHRAGLGSLSEKQMKALTAAHDGDWEPDLLKQTATELGFGEDKSQTTEPAGMDPAQEAAMRRVNSASNGEPPPAPPSTDQERAAAYATAESPERLKEMLREAGQLAE